MSPPNPDNLVRFLRSYVRETQLNVWEYVTIRRIAASEDVYTLPRQVNGTFRSSADFCVVLFCVLEFRGVGSDLKGIISRQAIVLS